MLAIGLSTCCVASSEITGTGMMSFLLSSASACCIAGTPKSLTNLLRVVSVPCRNSHYRPVRVKFSSRSRFVQKKMLRKEMDRSKGPNYCITPNPYRNLMGEQVPLSVHPAVVATLDRIVTMDLDKIFATKDGVTTVPKLVLADDSDLTKIEDYVLRKSREMLTRPPILTQRQTPPANLAFIRKNPEMDGYMDSKIVITNVDPGLRDNERHIYVRLENGDLLHAPYKIRDRVILTYFQRSRRRHTPEPVFHPIALQHVLDAGRHKEMLDRIFHQFRHDTYEYIRLNSQVYEDVYDRKCYEVLDSTCHFGNLVFYLCLDDRWEGLYNYFKEKDRVQQAADVFRLAMVLNKPTDAAFRLANSLSFVEDVTAKEKEAMDTQLVRWIEQRNKKAQAIQDPEQECE